MSDQTCHDLRADLFPTYLHEGVHLSRFRKLLLHRHLRGRWDLNALFALFPLDTLLTVYSNCNYLL